MGENSVINANCRIDNRGGIDIGKNVAISEQVVLLTADHDPDSGLFIGRTFSLKIEDYVWIGTNVLVLPNINLEKACIIAAGSVVTKNVSAFNIIAGNPAKYIRNRKVEELKYNTKYRRLFK